MSAAKKHTMNPKDRVPLSFPQRLMGVLSDDAYKDIISWLDHGKAFRIHQRRIFESQILPTHFRKGSQFKSFQRKLSRWGFRKVAEGDDAGAYFHPSFQRGDYRSLNQIATLSLSTRETLPPASHHNTSSHQKEETVSSSQQDQKPHHHPERTRGQHQPAHQSPDDHHSKSDRRRAQVESPPFHGQQEGKATSITNASWSEQPQHSLHSPQVSNDDLLRAIQAVMMRTSNLSPADLLQQQQTRRTPSVSSQLFHQVPPRAVASEASHALLSTSNPPRPAAVPPPSTTTSATLGDLLRRHLSEPAPAPTAASLPQAPMAARSNDEMAAALRLVSLVNNSRVGHGPAPVQKSLFPSFQAEQPSGAQHNISLLSLLLQDILNQQQLRQAAAAAPPPFSTASPLPDNQQLLSILRLLHSSSSTGPLSSVSNQSLQSQSSSSSVFPTSPLLHRPTIQLQLPAMPIAEQNQGQSPNTQLIQLVLQRLSARHQP